MRLGDYMSLEKIIKRFSSHEFDDNKKLTSQEIDQFLEGHLFDESLFNTISETFEISLWYLDIPTLKMHIDERAYNILGIKPGVYDHDFIAALRSIVHPDFLDYVNESITYDLLQSDKKAITFKILKSDGTESWLAIKGHYLNNDVKSRAAVGIVADITELITQKESIINYENSIRTILETVPTPIYFKDLDDRYQNFNKAFSDFLGRDRDELLGRSTVEVFSKEASDIYRSKDEELLEQTGQQIYDAILDTEKNGERLVRFHRELLYNSSGEPSGIVGSLYDVTEAHNKELKLQRMNQLLQSLIEVSQAVLEINTMEDLFQVVIEKALSAISASDFGCVLIRDSDDNLTILAQKGYSIEESEGFSIKLQDSFSYTFANGNLTSPLIIDNIQQIGDDFPDTLPPQYEAPMQSSLCTPIVIDGEIFALVNVDSKNNHVFDDYDMELMTILKNQIELVIRNMRLYQQVVHISQTDPLTGLFNRGYFENCIESIVKRAQRYTESFSLILIDLNNLKIVNDLLGHDVGDRYITNFANMFSGYIRGSDIVARFGGDEFVAVFFNGNSDSIKDRLQLINHNFMKQELTEDHHFIQSFSYGIAEFPHDGEEYNDLVRIADERMYHYKRELKSQMYNRFNL